MKYYLFILIFVAVLITSGWVGGNKSNVTPSQIGSTPIIIVTTTVPAAIPTPMPVSTTEP